MAVKEAEARKAKSKVSKDSVVQEPKKAKKSNDKDVQVNKQDGGQQENQTVNQESDKKSYKEEDQKVYRKVPKAAENKVVENNVTENTNSDSRSDYYHMIRNKMQENKSGPKTEPDKVTVKDAQKKMIENDKDSSSQVRSGC